MRELKWTWLLTVADATICIMGPHLVDKLARAQIEETVVSVK